MTRSLVNQTCAALPGASHSDPWGGGHDAWKVGGKLFAVVGATESNGLSVKCADVETAALLIDLGRAQKAPYFHASWVRIPFGTIEDAELVERIQTSYRIIRASLPKKLQATLAPF
jgi:predicted DNA-binding protein (MmcQ/YjbR family)